MAGVTLDIKVTGVPETEEALNHVNSILADLSPEMKDVGDYLLDFYSNVVWETEGGIYGAKWQQLTANTEYYKSKQYPGRGILERTGNLRHSLELMTTSSYARVRQNPGIAPYGIYHQTGTSRMPQRKFMELDDPRIKESIDRIKQGIQTRIREALL